MFLILLIFVTFSAIFLSAYSRFHALLFLIPLSVYSQSATVFSFEGRDINLGMDTIYIFIFITLGLINDRENKFTIKLLRPSYSLIILFAYLFLNVIVSSFMKYGGLSLSGLAVYVRLFQYIPIYIILSTHNINLKQSISVINTFIWTGISGSLLAVYQLYSGNYFYMKGMPSFTMPLFREQDISTEVGFYAGSGNYNVFAAFLLIPIFLNFIVWNSHKEIPNSSKKSFLIPMIVLFIGLYVANSRAAFLGVIIGLISMNINRKKVWDTVKTIVTIVVLVCFIGYMLNDNPFIKNITSIFEDFKKALPYAMENASYQSDMGFSGDTLGAVARIFGYLEAIRVFLLYPLFGCGFDLFLKQSVRYPENLFLQILAETGIVGCCLLLIFIYNIYRYARLPQHTNFNKHYQKVFHGMIIALIFVNMTGATLLIQKVWGPFLLISGFFCGYQQHTTIMEHTLKDGDER